MTTWIVRLGTRLYPLLTAFAIAGAPACTDDAGAEVDLPDEQMPDASMPDEPTPDAPMPDAPPAAGALDPTFGTNGVLELALGPAYAGGLAVQGDQLLVCYTHLDGPAWTARVVRLNQDGSQDMSFGTNGRITYANWDGSTTGCRDIVHEPNGRIVLSTRPSAGPGGAMIPFGHDGEAIGYFTHAGFSSQLTALRTKTGTLAGGVYDGNVGFSVDPVMGISSLEKYTYPSEHVARVLLDEEDHRFTVAAIPGPSGATWQVLTINAANQMSPLGPGARASAGTATADLLHDAMWLPDGSIFAFGGMDSDLQVMAARFVEGDSPTVDIEHHGIPGGVMTARAGVLDGDDRPILVGSRSSGGTTSFSWQRYEPSSVHLDESYQDGGLATAAAQSGSAELVDVVRLNGALFALGMFDVETQSPQLALVKIVE